MKAHSESDDDCTVISIIVPVFNAAEYLQDCLQSIESQTDAPEFEVILVDDGSEDASVSICRQWRDKNPRRYRLIENQRNRGVSHSRNRGLDAVRGEYFMFVDADDELPTDALATLHHAAEESGADIVKGNNTVFDRLRETQANHDVARCRELCGSAVLTCLLEHRYVRGHPWGKLFRGGSLGRYRFDENLRMSEDLYYCCETFSAADSLLLLNRSIYRYRRHAAGATANKYRSGAYRDWLDAVEGTARFARKPQHWRARQSLLLRTLAQSAREARRLKPAEAEPVLAEIEARREQWGFTSWTLLLHDRLAPRSWIDWIKLRQALGEIRRRIAVTE